MMTVNDQRGGGVQNWLRFFSEEREIWVQNTSNTQLSLQFELGQGQIQGVLVPISPDPMCLTQEVPFTAIKNSMDFRRFLNRKPTVMRILDEEEVNAYYTKRALEMGAFAKDASGQKVPDVSRALAAADEERRTARQLPTAETVTYTDSNGQTTFSPPRSQQELMNLNTPAHQGVPAHLQHQANIAQGFANAPGDQVTMTEQVINPRVVHLCQQVSAAIPQDQRWSAERLTKELKPMEAAMSIDDLQYVEAHGYYPTVKKWATRLIEQKAVAEAPESAPEVQE